MSKPAEFENRFLNYVKVNNLIDRNACVIAAYSGGIDSTVLVYLLNKFKNDLEIDLHLAYFNHNLRGDESIAEGKFIKKFAKDLNLSISTGTADLKSNAVDKNISIQESARELRYKFLKKTARKVKADIVATAHHKNDNIETILMRFLQGASPLTLRGIPEKREIYVRPLLWASKQELINYSRVQSISHFEDSSNSSIKYTRNKIRKNILPYLSKELGTNIDTILSNQISNFKEIEELVTGSSKTAYKDTVIRIEKSKIILDIKSYKSYFTLIRKNVLFDCFKHFSSIKQPSYISCFNKIDNFITGTKTRGFLYITNELLVYEKDNELHICREVNTCFEYPVTVGGENSFSELGFKLDISEIKSPGSLEKSRKTGFEEIIDKGCTKGSLIVRNWRQGDKFIPLGMKNAKKLSDFFTDLKLKPDEKNRIPILTDDEKIIWICGRRIDNRVKVTSKTSTYLKLCYSEI